MSHKTRFILIVTGAVVILAIVAAAANWQWQWLSGSPEYETPPLSADYLPSDAGAILRLNLRQTLDAKYANKEIGFALRSLREKLLPDAQDSLGINVRKDVDWVQLTVPAGDLDHPLVLLSGRFDPAKFKPSPKGLREVSKPGDRYRLYELPDEQLGRKFTLSVGDTLMLVCDKPSRVTEALADAAAGRNPALDDTTLADLLKKVDRTQAIWGAASLGKLSPIPKLEPAMAETILRPILTNAAAVYGGITCGDNVQGTVYFVASSPAKAMALEEKVRGVRDMAQGAYAFMEFAGSKTDYMPLLQFISVGKLSRLDNTVILRCELPVKK